MTVVELFRYQDREIRTLMVDDEPRLVVADVCAVLDLRDPSSALRKVDDEDILRLRRSDTPQFFRGIAPQVQEIAVVNESGVYQLVFQSRKPEARAFRRWVTSEVLPEIRRTGRYEVAPAAPAVPDLSTPAGVLVMAEQFAATARRLVVAEQRAEVAEQQVAELEPRAAAADALTEAAGTLSIGTVGKAFGVGRTTFFRILYAEGILCRDRTPRSEYAAWFRVVATERETSIGRSVVDHVAYLYPDGALRLHHLLTHRGYQLNKPPVGGQLALVEGAG